MKNVLCILGLAAALMAPRVASADLLAWVTGDKINGPDERIVLDSSVNGNHGAILSNTEVVLGAGNDGGAVDFGGGDASYMVFNTVTAGAFDSIVANQTFTVGFWLAGEESAVAPSNQSVFWFESPSNNGTARGIQSHAPWSNSNVYLDIGGCCSATQRVNGPIDRDFWDAETGDEWTHYVYTMDEFGTASVYIDGIDELVRDGPTDAIGDFAQIWWGSAQNGGNNFAGRMDDIVIADNALDFFEVEELYQNGPAAVWPDDVISDPSNPPDFEPAPPVIPSVDVDGQFVVPTETVDDVIVGTIDNFTQYILTFDGDRIDADHILASLDTTANTLLDLTGAYLKVELQGEFTVGDKFVPIFAKEVVGLDTVSWDFPDRGLFNEDGFNAAGGWRLEYVGAVAGAESVPEPSSLGILALGAVLLGLVRRRRR